MKKNFPEVYLAGPDVFFSDAEIRFSRLEKICFDHDLKGLRPSDGGMAALAGTGVSSHAMAQKIYHANVDHIRRADAVIANMSPFRGDFEPDSGTVFEVGMAIALGKPVALYLPQGLEDSGSKIRRLCGCSGNNDALHGVMIEDFGLPLNLMLACPAPFFDSPEEALDSIAKTLKNVAKSRHALAFSRNRGSFG